MTLVELLVALAVSSIVAAVAFAALGSTQETERFTDEDSQSLAELRTATQRLVSELRQAGSIQPTTGGADKCGSTARQIEFRVDYDRNPTTTTDAERIIWQLENDGRLTRRLRDNALSDPCNSSARTTHAESLVVQDVFTYNASPPDTTLVTILLSADVDTNAGAPRRTVRTDVRLRSARGPQ